MTTGGLDVLPAYDRFHPDVVLMDVMMPRFNWITISHALLSRDSSIRLILCSGAIESDHPFVAAAGASRFLQKPFSFSEAQLVIESLMPAAAVAAA